MKLFERAAKEDAPLAERVRPERLHEVIGQRALLEEGSLFLRLVKADRLPSLFLVGPPGTGKTTIARILAHETRATFVSFSAVLGGLPELRKHLSEAQDRRVMGRKTLLFIDEIHRFNKGQQDALLPHVESGAITLVGATTENPSFSINHALLSRARVFNLELLSQEDTLLLLQRAIAHPRGIETKLDEEGLKVIAAWAQGDARKALLALESLSADHRAMHASEVAQTLGRRVLSHDKAGSAHYDLASAMIKSIRGSDPDAALYWMARQLEAGEDPRFVSRRLIISASEDIGNADPRALELAIAADLAAQRLGMPEARHALAQCCVYLSVAPKSNASYRAYNEVAALIAKTGDLPVPLHLRNASSGWARSRKHGEGYRYPHDEGGYARGQTYLPEPLLGQRFYRPLPQGFEQRMRERLQRLRKSPEEE